ncbi:hypothetical protein [Caballeronia sp. DA-9]|uniref:hypothetical protein n=1 Tax=Caballeronia sp. DA-9 TaxID=3436237 RepID=UPI003F67E85D
MSWRRTLRMHLDNCGVRAQWLRTRHMSRTFIAARVVVCIAAIGAAVASQSAHAEAQPMSFAIASNVLDKPGGETALQQMLDAIGRERNTSFVVYDGNLKSEAEPCRDALYNARQQVFDSSRKPVILLPGGNDWASCNLPRAGSYDPVERLDFIRQLFFGDSNSLGQTPMNVIRESDVARFRPFRENVRWQANGIAFIGLNAPSPNNHYLTAGGRNGEFEDRSVANAFWIEHAVENARRADMHAIVVILQGDPDFARYERRDRFAWLRFSRGDTTRDGFLELKRSLVKAAESFRGPMIVIHGSDTPLPKGFRIDQPLRNDKGAVITNLTRIAIGLKNPHSQWLEVESDLNWRPPFRVRVRDVIARPNTQAPATVQGASQASTPAVSSFPAVEDGAPGPSSFFQQMQPVQPAQPLQQHPSVAPNNDNPASNAAPQVPPLLTPATPAPALPPILSVPSNAATPASSTSNPGGAQ